MCLIEMSALLTYADRCVRWIQLLGGGGLRKTAGNSWRLYIEVYDQLKMTWIVFIFLKCEIEWDGGGLGGV